MQTRFNDKPVVTFSCLSVCEDRNGNLLRETKSATGLVVTFNAYMPADKDKMKYTFNAFDEARERVIQMNLKKGSRIMVVAVLKNFIDKENVCRQSFTVCLIDYVPADNNQLIHKSENRAVQQSQQREAQIPMSSVPRNNSGSSTANYRQMPPQTQPQQQPIPPAVPKRQPYSFEQPEVNIDEFAMAIGGL